MSVGLAKRPAGLLSIADSNPFTESRARLLLENALKEKKETTRRAYLKGVGKFAEYCGFESSGEFLPYFFSATSAQANALFLEWKGDMVEQGYAPNTINQRMASVKFFVKIARMMGLMDWNLEVSSLKSIPYRDTTGCGIVAVREMLRIIPISTPIGRRDELMIRLFYGLGLRRNELASLNFGDLDLEKKRLSIIGKGRREKEWLSFDQGILQSLGEWLKIRRMFCKDPYGKDSPLFINFHRGYIGGRLGTDSIYRIVKKWGEKVGAVVSPHRIRHTSITEAIEAAHAEGIGIEKVRDFSRHADIRTLLIYQDRRDNVQGRLTEAIALPSE